MNDISTAEQGMISPPGENQRAGKKTLQKEHTPPTLRGEKTIRYVDNQQEIPLELAKKYYNKRRRQLDKVVEAIENKKKAGTEEPLIPREPQDSNIDYKIRVLQSMYDRLVNPYKDEYLTDDPIGQIMSSTVPQLKSDNVAEVLVAIQGEQVSLMKQVIDQQESDYNEELINYEKDPVFRQVLSRVLIDSITGKRAIDVASKKESYYLYEGNQRLRNEVAQRDLFSLSLIEQPLLDTKPEGSDKSYRELMDEKYEIIEKRERINPDDPDSEFKPPTENQLTEIKELTKLREKFLSDVIFTLENVFTKNRSTTQPHLQEMMKIYKEQIQDKSIDELVEQYSQYQMDQYGIHLGKRYSDLTAEEFAQLSPENQHRLLKIQKRAEEMKELFPDMQGRAEIPQMALKAAVLMRDRIRRKPPEKPMPKYIIPKIYGKDFIQQFSTLEEIADISKPEEPGGEGEEEPGPPITEGPLLPPPLVQAQEPGEITEVVPPFPERIEPEIEIPEVIPPIIPEIEEELPGPEPELQPLMKEFFVGAAAVSEHIVESGAELGEVLYNMDTAAGGGIAKAIIHPIKVIMQGSVNRRNAIKQYERFGTYLLSELSKLTEGTGIPQKLALEIAELALEKGKEKGNRWRIPGRNVLKMAAGVGQTAYMKNAIEWLHDQVESAAAFANANPNFTKEQIEVIRSSDPMQADLLTLVRNSFENQNEIGMNYAKTFGEKDLYGKAISEKDRMSVADANPEFISKDQGESRFDLKEIENEFDSVPENKRTTAQKASERIKGILERYLDPQSADRITNEKELVKAVNAYFLGDFRDGLIDKYKNEFQGSEVAENILHWARYLKQSENGVTNWDRYKQEPAKDTDGNPIEGKTAWQDLNINVYFGHAKYDSARGNESVDAFQQKVLERIYKRGFRSKKLSQGEKCFTRYWQNLKAIGAKGAGSYVLSTLKDAGVFAGGYFGLGLTGAVIEKLVSSGGKAGGAAVGAAVGSVFMPGFGTVIGGTLGGAVGIGVVAYLKETGMLEALRSRAGKKTVKMFEGRIEKETRQASRERSKGYQGGRTKADRTPKRNRMENIENELPVVQVKKIVTDLEANVPSPEAAKAWAEGLSADVARAELMALAFLNARRLISDMSGTKQVNYHTYNLLRYEGIGEQEGKRRWNDAVLNNVMALGNNAVFGDKSLLKGTNGELSEFDALTKIAVAQLRYAADKEQLRDLGRIQGLTTAQRSRLDTQYSTQLTQEREKQRAEKQSKGLTKELFSVDQIQKRRRKMARASGIQKGIQAAVLGTVISTALPEIEQIAGGAKDLAQQHEFSYGQHWSDIWNGKKGAVASTNIQRAVIGIKDLLAQHGVGISQTYDINSLIPLDHSALPLGDHLSQSLPQNLQINGLPKGIYMYDEANHHLYIVNGHQQVIGEFNNDNGNLTAFRDPYNLNRFITPEHAVTEIGNDLAGVHQHIIVDGRDTGIDVRVPFGENLSDIVSSPHHNPDGTYTFQISIKGGESGLVTIDPNAQDLAHLLKSNNPQLLQYLEKSDIKFAPTQEEILKGIHDAHFETPGFKILNGQRVFTGQMADHGSVLYDRPYWQQEEATGQYFGRETALHWNDQYDGLHYTQEDGLINIGVPQHITPDDPAQMVGLPHVPDQMSGLSHASVNIPEHMTDWQLKHDLDVSGRTYLDRNDTEFLVQLKNGGVIEVKPDIHGSMNLQAIAPWACNADGTPNTHVVQRIFSVYRVNPVNGHIVTQSDIANMTTQEISHLQIRSIASKGYWPTGPKVSIGFKSAVQVHQYTFTLPAAHAVPTPQNLTPIEIYAVPMRTNLERGRLTAQAPAQNLPVSQQNPPSAPGGPINLPPRRIPLPADLLDLPEDEKKKLRGYLAELEEIKKERDDPNTDPDKFRQKYGNYPEDINDDDLPNLAQRELEKQRADEIFEESLDGPLPSGVTKDNLIRYQDAIDRANIEHSKDQQRLGYNDALEQAINSDPDLFELSPEEIESLKQAYKQLREAADQKAQQEFQDFEQQVKTLQEKIRTQRTDQEQRIQLESGKSYPIEDAMEMVAGDPQEQGNGYWISGEIPADFVEKLSDQQLASLILVKPFFLMQEDGSWKLNEDVFKPAYDLLNTFPNTRFKNAEFLTEGDSGIFALAAASAPDLEHQAKYYRAIAQAILTIHARNENAIKAFLKAQEQQGSLIVFETNERNRVMERFLGRRLNKALNETWKSVFDTLASGEQLRYVQVLAESLDDHKDRMLQYKYDKRHGASVYDRSETGKAWQRRITSLQTALNSGSLTLEQIRQIEFLGHSVNVVKMVEMMQEASIAIPVQQGRQIPQPPPRPAQPAGPEHVITRLNEENKVEEEVFGRRMVGYGTNVGQKREHNEDNVLVDINKTPGQEYGLFIVADGMGGHTAGEVASKIAVDTVQRKYQEYSNHGKNNREEDIEANLKKAVKDANKAIDLKAQEPGQSGMGTTFAGVVVVNGIAYIANVGDSRVYIYSADGKLTQISQDHSWVDEQVRAGLLTKDQARTHAQRNVITRALGTEPDVKVDLFKQLLQPGDKIFVCSDGLSGVVEDKDIELILKNNKGNPFQAVTQLINQANKNGGPDNISAIILDSEIITSPAKRQPVRTTQRPSSTMTQRFDFSLAQELRIEELAHSGAEASSYKETEQALELRKFILRGLTLMREGIDSQDLNKLQEAMKYFKNEDMAEKCGFDFDSSPRAVFAGPGDTGKIESFEFFTAYNSWFSRQGKRPKIIISDVIEFQRNRPLPFEMYHNIALVHAEEWIHGLQYLRGEHSLTGFEDHEIDVAAFLQQEQIQLTERYLRRYNRSQYVQLESESATYEVAKDTNMKKIILSTSAGELLGYAPKPGVRIPLNKILLHNNLSAEKYNILLKTESGSIYQVDENGKVIGIRKNGESADLGTVDIPNSFHYLEKGKKAFLAVVEEGKLSGIITSSVADVVIYKTAEPGHLKNPGTEKNDLLHQFQTAQQSVLFPPISTSYPQGSTGGTKQTTGIPIRISSPTEAYQATAQAELEKNSNIPTSVKMTANGRKATVSFIRDDGAQIKNFPGLTKTDDINNLISYYTQLRTLKSQQSDITPLTDYQLEEVKETLEILKRNLMSDISHEIRGMTDQEREALMQGNLGQMLLKALESKNAYTIERKRLMGTDKENVPEKRNRRIAKQVKDHESSQRPVRTIQLTENMQLFWPERYEITAIVQNGQKIYDRDEYIFDHLQEFPRIEKALQISGDIPLAAAKPPPMPLPPPISVIQTGKNIDQVQQRTTPIHTSKSSETSRSTATIGTSSTERLSSTGLPLDVNRKLRWFIPLLIQDHNTHVTQRNIRVGETEDIIDTSVPIHWEQVLQRQILSNGHQKSLVESITARLRSAGRLPSNATDMVALGKAYAQLESEEKNQPLDNRLDVNEYLKRVPSVQVDNQQLPITRHLESAYRNGGLIPIDVRSSSAQRISLVSAGATQEYGVAVNMQTPGHVRIAMADGHEATLFPVIAARESVQFALGLLEQQAPSKQVLEAVFNHLQAIDFPEMADKYIAEKHGDTSNLIRMRNSEVEKPLFAATSLGLVDYDKEKGTVSVALNTRTRVRVYHRDGTYSEMGGEFKPELMYSAFPHVRYDYSADREQTISLLQGDIIVLYNRSLGNYPEINNALGPVIKQYAERGVRVDESIANFVGRQLKQKCDADKTILDDFSLAIIEHQPASQQPIRSGTPQPQSIPQPIRSAPHGSIQAQTKAVSQMVSVPTSTKESKTEAEYRKETESLIQANAATIGERLAREGFPSTPNWQQVGDSIEAPSFILNFEAPIQTTVSLPKNEILYRMMSRREWDRVLTRSAIGGETVSGQVDAGETWWADNLRTPLSLCNGESHMDQEGRRWGGPPKDNILIAIKKSAVPEANNGNFRGSCKTTTQVPLDAVVDIFQLRTVGIMGDQEIIAEKLILG